MFSILSQLIFGQSVSGGSGASGPSGRASRSWHWRDRSLCFDLRQEALELAQGEQLIGCFYPIEDTKGNPDEFGLLKVTNLRLIWICCRRKRVNLSIGWRTISLAYEQALNDPLGGEAAINDERLAAASSLIVLARHEATKYEFIFNRRHHFTTPEQLMSTNQQTAATTIGQQQEALVQLRHFAGRGHFSLSHLSPAYLDNPFEVVFRTWQAYKQTTLFRQCRANATNLLTANATATHGPSRAIRLPEDLNRLPGEHLVDLIAGVALAESRSVKHAGTLMLTNVRILWLDEALAMRNMSIPFLRIDSIKMKQTDRILVGTQDYLATTTSVEFRISQQQQRSTTDSSAKSKQLTKSLYEQMLNLLALNRSEPRFGPESCEESVACMSRLQPVESLFQLLDTLPLSAEGVQNFGPPVNKVPSMVDNEQQRAQQNANYHLKSNQQEEDDNNVNEAESEFNNYTAKLATYLNEQPIERDKELIYSTDFGLAMERPANGLNVKRIWHLEL